MDEEYMCQVELYKEISKEIKKPIPINKFKYYGLKDYRWFIKNCPEKITTYIEFYTWCGIYTIKNITKEKCSELIYKMQNNLSRPLKYNDFKNYEINYGVNIHFINKFWGTLNDMKKDLGLYIVREDMISKSKSQEDLLLDLENLIKELGHLPTREEINNCEYCSSSLTYDKYFGGINNAFIKLGYFPNKKSIFYKLSKKEIIDVYKAYIKKTGIIPSCQYVSFVYELPSVRTVLRTFNCTWNEFIKILGYKPNDNIYNVCYSKDGTKCLSLGERIIHDYLLTLPISELTKEVFYKDILDNEDLKDKAGFKRLDWTFKYNSKRYYVEYFGMMDIESYKKNHDEKINLLKDDNKLENLIPIYPKDINNLDEIFGIKEVETKGLNDL